MLRVGFPPEQSKYNTDNPQKQTMKVELNGDTEQFVRTFEAKVVEAGIADKDKLFKKGMFVPSDDAIKTMFMSKLSDQPDLPGALVQVHRPHGRERDRGALRPVHGRGSCPKSSPALSTRSSKACLSSPSSTRKVNFSPHPTPSHLLVTRLPRWG